MLADLAGVVFPVGAALADAMKVHGEGFGSRKIQERELK